MDPIGKGTRMNARFVDLLFVIAVVFLLALSGMYILGVGLPLLVRVIGPMLGAV
jgi:hypothetical protein